jgi:hypothetical protein
VPQTLVGRVAAKGWCDEPRPFGVDRLLGRPGRQREMQRPGLLAKIERQLIANPVLMVLHHQHAAEGQGMVRISIPLSMTARE